MDFARPSVRGAMGFIMKFKIFGLVKNFDNYVGQHSEGIQNSTLKIKFYSSFYEIIKFTFEQSL